MKRFAIGLVLVVLLSGAVFAQDAGGKESKFFVKTIYIERIYPHQLGYMVTYVTNDLRLQRLYVPIEWFGAADGKAEIVYGVNRAYPYMEIYWEDGEFSHLRLYVKRSLDDLSWGPIDQTEDLNDEFAVDGLELRL